MQNKFITIIGLVILCVYGVNAQNDEYGWQYAVGVSIFDEHIAFPFSKENDAPIHLGGNASFEMSKKRNGLYQFTHIFQIGYYYHKDFNQVAYLTWKPKFELRFKKLFNVHAILGAGYAHSFPTEQTYEFQNGSYQKKKNLGKPHFMPSIGFGAGFHLDKLIDIPLEAYVRYETFGLAPYAIKGTTPVTVNTMVGFGLTYTLN